MPISQAEWIEERRRLAQVMQEIARQLAAFGDMAAERKGNVIETRRSVWEEYRPDVANVAMRIETAGDLVQNRLEIERMERGYASAKEAVRKLQQLREAAYFGRIDFHEDGAAGGTAAQIYIGLAALINPATHEHLVYDWRSPIAGMYYDYPPGAAAYQTPDGPVSGTIGLKRQYKIAQGEIRYMFDTGLQIGDEMLQHILGRSADDKMRSIVTTIQREQNQVIRNEAHPVLIVQGAAGSGKTSIALQRAAYLLYKHRKSLSADKMILFSPNSLFSDYVSNVLPELGETNMRQTTFQEYAEFRIGPSVRLEDRYAQLEYILTQRSDPDYVIVRSDILFKTSPAFQQVAQKYTAHLAKAGMPFGDILYGDKVWAGGESLARLFYDKYARLPMEERLQRIKARLLGQLDDLKESRTGKLYQKLLADPKYLGTDEELHKLSQNTVGKRIVRMKREIESGAFLNVVAVYMRLFQENAVFERLSAGMELPGNWEQIRARTLAKLREGVVPCADVPPLLYLCEAITGFDSLNGIRHVIIDEAQDYSPFQFEIIRRLFPRSQLTLLGDLNQAIQPHMRFDGYSGIAALFGAERTGIVRLSKSYRSTAQIVAFTKAMLPGGEAVEAVERDGAKPLAVAVPDPAALPRAVMAEIAALQAEGAASIAVIGKSARECGEIFRALQGQNSQAELHQLTKDDVKFRAGTVVIPAYLAKGLEFDAVIIYEAGRSNYEHEEERKLFYTACTRAMHQLRLFYTGELTRFAADVPDVLYETATFI